MIRIIGNSASVVARLSAGMTAAAFVLGVTASGQALAAKPGEVTLASAAQALAFCQAGSMKGNAVAYFAGSSAGEVQYGPNKKCKQGVPPKKVSEAIQVVGSTVSECKLATATQATTLCNAGGIGEWDIDYIAGPDAEVIGGPGYGCGTNITTGTIGNAVCK